jgi:hypothetical protein
MIKAQTSFVWMPDFFSITENNLAVFNKSEKDHRNGSLPGIQ